MLDLEELARSELSDLVIRGPGCLYPIITINLQIRGKFRRQKKMSKIVPHAENGGAQRPHGPEEALKRAERENVRETASRQAARWAAALPRGCLRLSYSKSMPKTESNVAVCIRCRQPLPAGSRFSVSCGCHYDGDLLQKRAAMEVEMARRRACSDRR